MKYENDTDLVGVWKSMEKMAREGKAKSIGVSNFNSEQLERISATATVPIAVNQIECNVYFMQKRLRETMDKLGIKVMAYGPLGSPGRPARPGAPPLPKMLEDPIILNIAKSHGKSPAQVRFVATLRWKTH